MAEVTKLRVPWATLWKVVAAALVWLWLRVWQIVDLFRDASAKPDASMLAPYAIRLGRAVATAASVFVLAFVLVFYFLMEGAHL